MLFQFPKCQKSSANAETFFIFRRQKRRDRRKTKRADIFSKTEVVDHGEGSKKALGEEGRQIDSQLREKECF